MHYFRAVKGRVVKRFGTSEYLAARLQFAPAAVQGGERKCLGFVQDLNRIVQVTDAEYIRFRREYRDSVRWGDLKEATEADYKHWLKSQEQSVS